jgi:hypothetical protein
MPGPFGGGGFGGNSFGGLPESPGSRALRKKLGISRPGDTFISSDGRVFGNREGAIDANATAEETKGLPPCQNAERPKGK